MQNDAIIHTRTLNICFVSYTVVGTLRYRKLSPFPMPVTSFTYYTYIYTQRGTVNTHTHTHTNVRGLGVSRDMIGHDITRQQCNDTTTVLTVALMATVP